MKPNRNKRKQEDDRLALHISSFQLVYVLCYYLHTKHFLAKQNYIQSHQSSYLILSFIRSEIKAWVQRLVNMLSAFT
jgi:hypothetical protein